MTQKLDIIGTDNLSQRVTLSTVDTTIPATSEEDDDRDSDENNNNEEHRQENKKEQTKSIVTLTDEAGHRTVLTFITSRENEGRRIEQTLTSISYDGITTPLTNTTFQYKWNTKKKKNTMSYTLFASNLRVGSSVIESHYIAKKNITIIMQKPEVLGERDEDSDEDGDAEKRKIKTQIPGMIIPSLITKQGTATIKY